jgi:hypothetical protein
VGGRGDSREKGDDDVSPADLIQQPHRRAEDMKWTVRFGRATQTVLPPLFAIIGIAVFAYHGFGIHQLVEHWLTPTVVTMPEEVGWIELVLFIIASAAAFGQKHFDAIALAFVQRVSVTHSENVNVDAAKLLEVFKHRDTEKGIDPA